MKWCRLCSAKLWVTLQITVQSDVGLLMLLMCIQVMPNLIFSHGTDCLTGFSLVFQLL
jgi:hypothetical protein